MQEIPRMHLFMIFNSETDASELLENREEMFLRYWHQLMNQMTVHI